MKDFTVVITSSNRFDLLKQTVLSLSKYLDKQPREYIIIEDSDNSGIFELVEQLDLPIKVIFNEQRMGQIKSIDKAYQAVKTPYVFHCEDDWEFIRTGFIEESMQILNTFPQASMVGLRARDQLNPRVRKMPEKVLNNIHYFDLDPSLHPEYFSYSFNPGLRRHKDYLKLAPLESLGHEEDISYHFKQLGFYIANLELPAVKHIGDERHVNDPNFKPRAKTFFSKLQRSFKKRIKRIKRFIKNQLNDGRSV
ncbi:MAG: glycosyl transferase family 2 [Puniceicoccaceae bacterium]|nr:glycosyl transferase family 2 [Puniceicoccaceae bacterium]|tara:strand:- start:12 stop:764 length:753 start_codon:yes stop_codon:yes gene_type:complete